MIEGESTYSKFAAERRAPPRTFERTLRITAFLGTTFTRLVSFRRWNRWLYASTMLIIMETRRRGRDVHYYPNDTIHKLRLFYAVEFRNRSTSSMNEFASRTDTPHRSDSLPGPPAFFVSALMYDDSESACFGESVP